MFTDKLKELLIYISHWCFNNSYISIEQDIWKLKLKLKSGFCELSTTDQYNATECIDLAMKEIWNRKEFKVLEKCYLIMKDLQAEENPFVQYLPCLDEMNRLIHDYNICSSELERDSIWAKGFAVLYYYSEAIKIFEGIVDELDDSEIDLLKDIRLNLYYLYDETDADSENAVINIKELLLYDIDDKTIEALLVTHYEMLSDEIIIQFLKKHDDSRWWEFFYAHHFINEERLVHLYESVKPECALPAAVYEIIGQVYLDKGDITKARNCFDTYREKTIDRYNPICDIKLLVAENKMDEAMSTIDALLEQEPDNWEYIIYKGLLLRNLNESKEALDTLLRCKDRDLLQKHITAIVWCYLQEKREDEAIEFCRNYANCDYFLFHLYYWISSNSISPSFIKRLLGEIEVKSLPLVGDYASYIQLCGHIFRITSSVPKEQVGEIRYLLLAIYSLVRKLRASLQIDLTEIPGVFHYSTSDSLKYLPLYSDNVGGSRFRLSNVAYLNDPQEGRIIYKMLGIDESEAPTQLEFQNVYLGSFSMKNDSLPMWVQYSEDGKGCCYEINKSLFSGSDHSVEEHIILPYSDNSVGRKRKKPPLYKVYYYDENKQKSDFEIAFEEICSQLGESIQMIANDRKQSKRIDLFIEELLDSVRFLIKDAAYSTEKEIRIVMVDYYNQKKVDSTRSGVPHLYMELGSTLQFDRVILGPKATDVKAKAAYLRNCSNVKDVSESSIKYV